MADVLGVALPVLQIITQCPDQIVCIPTFIPKALFNNLFYIAILVNVGIAALAFMASRFLDLPGFKGWVNNELYEIFFTMALGLIMVYVLTNVASIISASLTGFPDPFIGALLYLKELKVYLILNYFSLELVEMMAGFISTLSFSVTLGKSVPLSLITLDVFPFAGMQMLTNSHTLLVDQVGLSIAMVTVFAMLLEFIRQTALSIYFPIGLLLRAFPFTRRLGSTLMALAITVYFIYPLTFMLSAGMYQQIRYSGTPDSAGIATNPFLMTPEGAIVVQSVTGASGGYAYSTALEAEADETTTGTLMDKWSTDAATALRDLEQQHQAPELSGWEKFKAWATQFTYKVKNWWSFMWGNVFSPFFNLLWVFVKSYGIMGTVLSSGIQYFGGQPQITHSMLFHFVIGHVQEMTRTLSFVFFSNFIQIVITISLYRNIAGSLGGQEDLFGFTKYI